MRVLVRNTRPSTVRAAGHYFRPRSTTPAEVDEAGLAALERAYGLVIVGRPAAAAAPARPAAQGAPADTAPANPLSRLPGPSGATVDAATGPAFPCPTCDFVARSQIGLASHRRARHKE